MNRRKKLGRNIKSAFSANNSIQLLPLILIGCYCISVAISSLLYVKKWLLPVSVFDEITANLKEFLSLGFFSLFLYITAASLICLLILFLSGIGAGGIVLIPLLMCGYGTISGIAVSYLLTDGREVLLIIALVLPALALFGAALLFCGNQAFTTSFAVLLCFQQKPPLHQLNLQKYSAIFLPPAVGSILLSAVSAIWISLVRFFA